MRGVTLRLSASELMSWCESIQWFYPATMKLSTFIALRADFRFNAIAGID